MTGHEGKEYEYERLMEAVRYSPHTVASLVAAEPELLHATNYSGETVMHWFVVENDLQAVELLYSCGGQVSDYALTQACSLGSVDMVYLLLKNNVVPQLDCCRNQIELGEVQRKTRVKLKQAFHRYGYKLYET